MSPALLPRMRMITMLLLSALCFCSGCPNVEIPYDAGVDLRGPLPLCDPRAEGVMSLRCHYGVDTQCRSAHGYDCSCACTGYWECDQVKLVCDPDAGAPHD
jgi:hypothetical protein